MNKGRIVQIGTPREIYENPADPFVVDFIGTSSFFSGTHAGQSASGAGCSVQLPSGLRIDAMAPRHIAQGSQVTVAVRPERIHLCVNGKPPVEEPGTLLPGTIATRSYMGARFQYEVLVGDVTVKVEAAEIGDVREVSLWVPEAAAIAFATQ
jgi:iron(III) transport system ATP-binding protein